MKKTGRIKSISECTHTDSATMNRKAVPQDCLVPKDRMVSPNEMEKSIGGWVGFGQSKGMGKQLGPCCPCWQRVNIWLRIF